MAEWVFTSGKPTRSIYLTTYISDNDLHQLCINRQLRNLKSIVICTIYRPFDCPLTSRFDTDLAPNWITSSLQNDSWFLYSGTELQHTWPRLQRSQCSNIPASLETNSRNWDYPLVNWPPQQGIEIDVMPRVQLRIHVIFENFLKIREPLNLQTVHYLCRLKSNVFAAKSRHFCWKLLNV